MTSGRLIRFQRAIRRSPLTLISLQSVAVSAIADEQNSNIWLWFEDEHGRHRACYTITREALADLLVDIVDTRKDGSRQRFFFSQHDAIHNVQYPSPDERR